MTMLWVGIAAGGSALLGAGASYLGSKKQADAAKRATDVAQTQAGVNNAQQQPYVQSGYGALSRLNTLMGIGGNAPGSAPIAPQTGGQYLMPTAPQIGTNMHLQPEPNRNNAAAVSSQNPQLRQILAIRANNGDTQAGQLLKMVM